MKNIEFNARFSKPFAQTNKNEEIPKKGYFFPQKSLNFLL